jgi:hypothetical protein
VGLSLRNFVRSPVDYGYQVTKGVKWQRDRESHTAFIGQLSIPELQCVGGSLVQGALPDIHRISFDRNTSADDSNRHRFIVTS